MKNAINLFIVCLIIGVILSILAPVYFSNQARNLVDFCEVPKNLEPSLEIFIKNVNDLTRIAGRKYSSNPNQFGSFSSSILASTEHSRTKEHVTCSLAITLENHTIWPSEQALIPLQFSYKYGFDGGDDFNFFIPYGEIKSTLAQEMVDVLGSVIGN